MTKSVYCESNYYLDRITGKKVDIDLNSYLKNGKLVIEDYDVAMMKLSSVHKLISNFKKHCKIDFGELEAIYYIFDHKEYKFCSGDAAAYKMLAYLGMSENAISLAQIIGQITGMEKQFTEKFMKECIAQGNKWMIEDL